jgi:ADP-ribose pyrophosphatase YjhB (NUDIX family)
MAEKEFLGDRRRKEEEEYFRRQEQLLIDKLRQRAREEAARRDMAERTGLADQEILRDLEALGYTPDTVRLLHLVPLLQVASADGAVSDRERALVIEAARAHGVEHGSAADQQLAAWLAAPPAPEFFDKTLRVIGAILQALPPDEREGGTRNLLSYSTAIASASGGILGFGKVSQAEQRVLARITEELQRAHGPVVPTTSPTQEGRS